MFSSPIHMDSATLPRKPATVSSEEQVRRIAERLQRVLLRTHCGESLNGLSIETFYEAALDEARVGGDSCDAFPLTGGRIALAVADASGKGLDAAERIAEVRFALRAFLREHDAPRFALSRLNEFVCDAMHLDGRDMGGFVTLTLAVVECATGKIECLCAGGEPPLIVRADASTQEVLAHGTALGICTGVSYRLVRATLDPMDTLLLVTDGITEAHQFCSDNSARSRGHTLLGQAGLVRLATASSFSSRATSSASQMGQAVFAGARAFAGGAFHDDACLIVARLDKQKQELPL